MAVLCLMLTGGSQDVKFGDLEFKSHSDHQVVVFLEVPSATPLPCFVNTCSQQVHLLSVTLSPVQLCFIIYFH